jgi:hypothetical protein
MAAGGAAAVAGLPLVFHHRTRTVVPEAKRHYELGEMFANRRTRNDLANAINESESAVRIDPAYPDAWVGLATLTRQWQTTTSCSRGKGLTRLARLPPEPFN